ncbi:MAG: hypothetical protein C4524_14255 [Candidatus Zixiibacteriota bacterium]|nr:MAG: hypothetical protein C4524_14255 [candidate division Zixibacteria bacterium]
MAQSSHAELVRSDRPAGPACVACHGYHGVKASDDPTSRTHRRNINAACLSCHADQEVHAGSGVIVKAYQKSVHGRMMQEGQTSVAECVDCHGSHHILPADDPDSPVHKPQIPHTCGQCHAQVVEDYRTSIHGQELAKGVTDSPVCTDCHGEHTIEAPDMASSRVAPANVPETCGKCHGNVQLTDKYGLSADRFATYKDSYHGVANHYGRTLVANCASCHGFHKVLPPSDPASTIHPANLAHTCGRCHPNAGEKFTEGKMHVAATFENSPGVFIVRQFYYIFIGGLMVIFVAYIVIEQTGSARRRRERKGR